MNRRPRVMVAPLPGTALALLLAAAAVSPGRAALSPTAALTAALRGPIVAFQGEQRTTVHLDTGPVSTEVVVHNNGRGAERREYRKGAAAGVVTLQKGQTTWQRQGSGAWLRLPETPKQDPSATAARIARNYRVTVGSPAKLAGRPVVLVRIVARSEGNPSRRLWLDQRAGIIVKDELFAPDGRIRSSTAFTRITPVSPSPSLFTVPKATTADPGFGPASFEPKASAAEVERLTGRPLLLPRHVPSGYRVEMAGVMRTRPGFLMPAVRYSDGLAAFTIFQRGQGGPGGGPGGGQGRGMGRGQGGPGQGGQGRGRGRGPGGGMGQGRGRGPGDGLGMMRSDRQRSVVAASGERSNYLLVGDISEEELQRIAASLP